MLVFLALPSPPIRPRPPFLALAVGFGGGSSESEASSASEAVSESSSLVFPTGSSFSDPVSEPDSVAASRSWSTSGSGSGSGCFFFPMVPRRVGFGAGAVALGLVGVRVSGGGLLSGIWVSKSSSTSLAVDASSSQTGCGLFLLFVPCLRADSKCGGVAWTSKSSSLSSSSSFFLRSLVARF